MPDPPTGVRPARYAWSLLAVRLAFALAQTVSLQVVVVTVLLAEAMVIENCGRGAKAIWEEPSLGVTPPPILQLMRSDRLSDAEKSNAID